MIRRLGFGLALACLVVVLTASQAPAFYTWVDDHGQLHVADYPKPGKPDPETAADTAQDKKPADSPKAEPVKAVQPAGSPEKTAVLPVAAPQPKSEPRTAQSASSQPGSKTVTSPTATALATPAVSVPARIPIPPQTAPQRTAQPASPGNAALAAVLLAGLGSVFLVIVVLLYLYFSLCLYFIAKKLNLSGTWTAWVPILQIFTFISCAHKPAWWFVLLLVPLVNFFITIYLWMCIAENLGREKWFALLTIVPVVNFIYMGVLAFSKGEGQASPAGA